MVKKIQIDFNGLDECIAAMEALRTMDTPGKRPPRGGSGPTVEALELIADNCDALVKSWDELLKASAAMFRKLKSDMIAADNSASTMIR